MQKVDLDSMSIEDLAQLRDQATEKLAEKVASRQRELAAEMERLSAYGKMTKAPAPKKEAKDLKDVKEALQPQPQAVKAA